jgi:DNA-binding CsgD family transcriptional regulator/PAS domain-containing protein
MAIRMEGIEPGFAFTYGISPDNMSVWENSWAAEDIWTAGGLRKGLIKEGNTMLGEDLVSDAEFLSSSYYVEFLSKLGMGRLLSGIVFDGKRAGLPTSACSILRGRDDRPFTMDDAQRHKLIVNHLSRAIATMWHLRDREMQLASTFAALGKLSTPIILLDGKGAIFFANEQAEQILATGDGLSGATIGLSAHRTLKIADNRRQLQLDNMIRRSIDECDEPDPAHFSDAVRAPRRSATPDYVVRVAPLARANPFTYGSSYARAIVFISDPTSMDGVSGSTLRKIYGLTAAEAQVALEVLKGDGVEKMAARLQITPNTTKKHLQGVFVKTGTNRQAELVRLLMALRS